MAEKERKMLTVREVAERQRVTELTVRRWLYSGRLKADHPGPKGRWRISEDDLTEFLRGREA